MINPDVFPRAIVSIRDLKAIFARWAIAQSPYTVPDRLAEVLEDLANMWRLLPEYAAIGNFEFVVVQKTDIRVYLEAFIKSSQIVRSWNNPFDESANYPDNDFIDIDALRMNVGNDLIEISDKN